MKIVIFSRDCGATTGFNTQVSILKAEQKLPSTSGNTFIGEQGILSAAWTSSQSIQILLSKDMRVFLKKDSIDAISVSYKQE